MDGRAVIHITLASAFWVVVLLVRLRATSFMAITVPFFPASLADFR